jgi:hypothetical protein
LQNARMALSLLLHEYSNVFSENRKESGKIAGNIKPAKASMQTCGKGDIAQAGTYSPWHGICKNLAYESCNPIMARASFAGFR